MSCRLVKNPNGNGYTPDSLKQLRDLLIEGRINALKMSNDGGDIPLLSLGIEKMLHSIGDTYHNQDLDKIVPLVEGFLKRLGWDAYIPNQGLYNSMSKKFRRTLGTNQVNLTYYTGNGNTLEEVKEINRLFLDRTFGSLADIKDKVKQQASHIMINTFIINREDGVLVQNITEANANAKYQKQKLYKQIVEYFNSKDIPTELFIDDKYTYALQDDAFKTAINELEAILFSVDSSRRIQELYSESHNSNAAKAKYDAAIAWFILKNFDNFVDTLIGSAFNINPEYRGKFVDDDIYSYSDKGHHLITSWITSDEIVLETRINKLAQTLINTTPLMSYGTETKSGNFIKFEDFYRIITKIKDLALDPITSEIVLSSTQPLGKSIREQLSKRDWELVKDRPLRWVINNIRTNPQKFTRLTLQIINSKLVMDELYSKFSKEEKDKCWSIYKGIFDPTYSESINNIQNKYDYRAENYYASLTQVADAIYSVNHLQYNDDEGIITLRSLRDQSSDNIRRELESNILRSNTRRRNYDFEKNEMLPYNAKPIEEDIIGGKELKGLSYELKIGENNSLQVRVTEMGGTISYKLNGKTISKIDESPEILDFVAQQLKINFNQDKEFLKNYYNVTKNPINELMDLSSIILLNKYVSNVVLKDVKGPKQTKQRLKTLYLSSNMRPGYDGLYNEMKIIPDSKITVLERLAKAKSWTTGEAQSSLVRDAEGDAISTQTLSRLLGALSAQFEQLRDYKQQKVINLKKLEESGKYKNLTIEFVDNIPTQKTTPVAMSVNRDTNTIQIVKSLMVSKFNEKAWTNPAIQLDGSWATPLPKEQFQTFEEFLTFCLEHEYQHTLHPRTTGLTTGEYETKINNYALASLGFKADAAVSGFSLLNPGFYKGFANIKELKSPLGNKQHTQFTVAEYIQGNFLHNFVKGFMSFTDYSGKHVTGNGIIGVLPSVNSDKNTIGISLFDLNQIAPNSELRWSDLSYESLSEITRKELGEYYIKQQNSIINTYKRLSYLYPEIPLDYENDFRAFNNYCVERNIKAIDKLFELTLNYNKNNPLSPIKLIDQVHYIKDGNSVRTNNTIKALANRYQDKSKYDAFMKLKELDLLQALTDENVSINLYDTFDGESPGKWLQKQYPTWIGKNGHNNGKMTLAKISKNGLSFDITSKQDLQKAAKTLGIDISKNLHQLKGVNIEMHPMLQKWNAFDYLLSQEFLLSGVGSHVAHPSKAKSKTAVIWVHPAMGKTYTVENTQYKDQIMDWDVEFNRKRDAWIAKQSGTEIGTDSFKIARNEYQINWKNHEDFQEFVTKEWNRVKDLANKQNKILVASPHMLLQLFPNDFNQVLTMSKEDFIERNVARGANSAENSELWKIGIDNTINSLANNVDFGRKVTIVGKGEYLQNILDSGKLSYALDQLLDNEILEEASRFLAQNKRNGSYTAAMHPFQLNQIDGIPEEYNMAVINDIRYELSTVMGDTANHAPFDGATFVNPLVVYWENNSLKGDKAGIDKKQFIHYYDEVTGTGGIIKTAGFGITNDRAKNRKFYRTMAYNMMKRPWVNPDGTTHITLEGGILKDFEGNTIDYGPIYFSKGSKYYLREIVNYNNDNTYTVIDSEVDEQGDIINIGQETLFSFDGDSKVTSNYDVWQLFGGWNSMEMGENGVLIPSENSLKLTAHAANIYGIKKYPGEKVEDASDIIQPMKLSDIHYMPTVGAIKQGASNINPKSMYYNKGTLNHMRVKMRQAGIQLDKEHHADGSVLSLMTQVMSAAAAKGYTITKSSKLYESLYNLTKLGTKDFRDSLGNITSDPDQFDAAVSHIILQTILNSSSNDGNLLQNIAKELIVEFQTNRDIKLTKEFADKIDSNTPYSSRSIHAKLVTALTSSLTKAGIKQEISGILAVLNPTQDAVKLYKVPVLDSNGNIIPGKYKTCSYGQLERYFDIYGVDNEEAVLQAIQNEVPPIYEKQVREDGEIVTGSITNVEIGKHYIIDRTDGTSEIIYLSMPHSLMNEDGNLPEVKLGDGTIITKMGYKDLKNDLFIERIREYLIEGDDLKSYNVRFTGTYKLEDGTSVEESYQMADLDVVQDFFTLKQYKGLKQYNAIIDTIEKYGKLQTLYNVITNDLQKVWELKLEKARSDKNSYSEAKAIKILSLINTFKENPYAIYTELEKYEEDSIEKLFLNYVINNAQKVLHRQLQLTLNGISKSDNGVKYVWINGKKVQIDKSSIKTQGYGVVMPKTFKTNLGLDDFDDLETIKNDPDFFVKKLIKRFNTKVDNFIDFDDKGNEVEIYNFHLELKKNNGNHIYVRQGLNGAKLGNKINIYKYTDPEGHVFRCDSNGNIIHPLFSVNDEVYIDSKGNEIIVTSPDTIEWKDTNGNNIAVIKNTDGSLSSVNGDEIIPVKDNIYLNTKTGEQIEKIETSGLQFYLDNLEYNSIYINKAVNNDEFVSILGKAYSSKNSVANNIANKIIQLGAKEKSPTKVIEKQRELSDKLGNYEQLLSLDPEGPQKDFFKFANNHITRLGRRMHTSFLKSLKIVAARIPAQNQQSFMGMEVEAYDNPDINSAYVSTYQFFLQGSDLDIDAVSLQTFVLNNAGIYVGHSPYYNLESEELAIASELLPFPNGEKIQLVESENQSTLEKYFDEIKVHDDTDAETKLLESIFGDELGQELFNLFIKKNGEVKLNLNLNFVENIEQLAELLLEKEVIKAGDTFINKLYNERGIVLTQKQVDSLNKQLVDIINKHNLYLNKSNVTKRTNISRNWLTQQTYDIIIDPINQLEAQSSVDAVTSNAKNLAKKSPKASVQDTFSPGNVINKYQSIQENMVGKDGIAICATGLKSFFALTQLHNIIMSGENVDAKESLLCNVKIGGKIYHGLANVFTDKLFTGEEEYEEWDINFEKRYAQDAIFSEKVKDYLIEQLRASDASNEFSALLSLSTDNAKELVLAKINAGTSTIGMYLYGLSLGIPFDTLYKIMTSPLAFRLSELTKGDSFNEDSGTIDVIGALDYILQEPSKQIAKFDSVDFSEYNGIVNPSTFLLRGKGLRDTIKKIVGNNGKVDYNAAQEYFDSLRNKVNEITQIIKSSNSETKEQDAIKYTIQYNQLIDFAIQYVEDMRLAENTFYETIYGGGNILTDFETLAMGANEMKQLGKLLRLNQEIKTNPQELIEQVANIENALIKRASQIRRYNIRHSKPFDPGTLSEKDEQFYNSIINERGNGYKKLYKIDFQKFVTDESYAQDMIKRYDVIKASYNPLKVLYEVTHYKGYMESLYIAYQGWKNKSSKFKLLVEEKSRIESKYNIYDSKLKEQVGKNLEDRADIFYRSRWMQGRYRPIALPASTKERTVFAFGTDAKKAMPIHSIREIQLGTTIGDANFKLWMEEVVIPELKRRFPNNKFIQDLKFTVNPKTPAGTIATSMGLSINMLPRSEYEKDTFNSYKQAFNNLSKEKDTLYSDAKGNLYQVQELLFLYSLITTNGRLSQTSIHGIFEDYMLDPVAIDFNKAISEMDKQGDITVSQIKESFIEDDVIPFSTRYRGGSARFKEFDKETEEIKVYELNDNDYSEDPNEESGGYSPKYVLASSPIVSGFNTDYFLNAFRRTTTKPGDITILQIDEKLYPELSNYIISIEELANGSKRLVDIRTNNPEYESNAINFYEYLRKNHKSKMFIKILKGKEGKKEEIDFDGLNDALKTANC